jgi:c-di-GMP-binding flagellar brake protein YcgR
MEERRRFFRLDDEVVLDFQVLSPEDDPALAHHTSQVKSELQEIEQEIGTLIYQLKSHNPQLSRLGELLNQKLNLLALGAGQSNKQRSLNQSESRTRINLSACGMAFNTAESLELGLNLLLNLQLKPSNANLELHGRVVAIEESDEEERPHHIRVDFENLTEAEQEIIIQHLFQLQNRNLKARHQEHEDDDEKK